ncbi:MAG TPA: thioesterase domain-containing protein, partial [Myxococcales bacterium]|nr:thioesterase domain-containing protein [Myxococcales bacterium]
PGRPIYALQPPGLDAEATTSIEAMARRSLSLLREIQPSGPYLLGGWSAGGVVAFEMALQLQDGGERTALLALVDSRAPSGEPAPPPDELSLLGAFGLSLGLPWQHITLDPERLGQLHGRALLAYALDQARRAPGATPTQELDLDEAERALAVFKRQIETLHQYRPRRYAGPAALFTATELLGEATAGGDLGWSRWISGPLAIHPAPGDHFTLLRAPHAAVLAGLLARHLDHLET